MDFRRSAARRRRVMREDVLDSGSQASPNPSRSAEFQRYNSSEVLKQQPSLLDWLPRRSWTNRLFSLGWLLLAALMLAGHYHRLLPRSESAQAGQGDTLTGSQDLLWSLNQASSLTQLFWTASGLLAVFLAYQLFLLRRHREDDYTGTYRVWLWALPVVALVAGTGVPSLRLMFQMAMATLVPSSHLVVTQGSLMILLAAISSALTLRLLWEVAESRWALTLLVLAGTTGTATWILLAAITLQWNVGPMGQLPADLPLAGGFVATVALSVGLISYFGYVCRDISGQISHSAPAPTTRATAKASRKVASKRTDRKERGPSRKNGRQATDDTEQAETAASSEHSATQAKAASLSRRRRRRQAA